VDYVRLNDFNLRSRIEDADRSAMADIFNVRIGAEPEIVISAELEALFPEPPPRCTPIIQPQHR
jgi:hypothetical protein